MEFQGAFLDLEELAAYVEELKQLDHRKAEEFLIITSEPHVNEVSELTNIQVETPENTHLSRTELLKEKGLEEDVVERYEKTVNRGGYVLLKV